MFKHKKNTFVLLALCLSMLAAGCLYEQGPIFSFNSPEYRIAYSWQFNKVQYNNLNVLLANNKDSINYGLSYLAFDKTGRFSFLVNSLKVGKKGNFVYTGDWSLANEKRDLVMQYDSTAYPTRTYRIIKLTENDFRLRLTEGYDNTVFYLIPKTK